MIKRKMQEWADFTGCYVAKNEQMGFVNMFISKPAIDEKEKWWILLERNNKGYISDASLSAELFTDFAERDWRVLVEPHMEAGNERRRKDA